MRDPSDASEQAEEGKGDAIEGVAAPGPGQNVTVNVQNVHTTATTSKAKQVSATPRKPKTKKKAVEEVGAKICEALDDLRAKENKETESTAVDYAFASYSKRIKGFLTDSQQEECLQEIG